MRRLRLGLLLLCATGGCTAWRATSVRAATVPTANDAHRVRFVRTDGDTVTLERAAVVGDSLVGWQGRRRLATPLAEVRHVETNRIDTRRTLQRALTVYGVGLAILTALTLQSILAM